jgi:hypothetical protein
MLEDEWIIYMAVTVDGCSLLSNKVLFLVLAIIVLDMHAAKNCSVTYSQPHAVVRA